METLPSYNVDTGTAPYAVRCVDNVPQVRRNGTAWRMAKAYRTTDPVSIGLRLMEAGFTVERAHSLFSHRTGHSTRWSRWTYGIEARFPGPSFDGYHDRARLLLNHSGREAFKTAFGALRGSCANQFAGNVVSIRHTDPALDLFLEDPAGWLLNLRAYCGDTVRMVEGLRGRPIPIGYLSALDAYPRLRSAVREEIPDYVDRVDWAHGQDQDLYSLWSLAQALTATRNTRAIQAAHVLAVDHVGSVEGRPFMETPSPRFLKLFAKN